MPKFKIGDHVKFHRERVTSVGGVPDLWSHLVDTSKVYTVTRVSENGQTITLDDDHGFSYHCTWLEKVDDRIKDVKFSGPATIVFWTDGTKTVVKCRKGDKFDPEKGIAMACAKKLMGNEDGYHREIAKYTKTAKKDESALLDTEKLRDFVEKTCHSFIGCTDCPCNFRHGGKCFIIATANREQLLMMYRQFLHAGKLWKEESDA